MTAEPYRTRGIGTTELRGGEPVAATSQPDRWDDLWQAWHAQFSELLMANVADAVITEDDQETTR